MSFSIACDRDFKSQSGEKETVFIGVAAWHPTEEFVSRYFTKGRMAVAEGRLQIRDWTDRDGTKRRNAEIVVNNVYFGNSRLKEDHESGEGQEPSPPPSGSFGGMSKDFDSFREETGDELLF